MSEKYKKIIQNKDNKIIQLNQKILHYRSELEKYRRLVDRLKKGTFYESDSGREQVNISAPKEKEDPNYEFPVIASFNYATFLEKDLQEVDNKINLLGNFTFENISNTVLEEPVICLRVKPVSKIQIGGKITVNPLPNDGPFTSQLSEEWIYAQKDWKKTVKERGEHWLKATHLAELNPGEKGKFSSFNISIAPHEEYSHYVIEGFFYARNHQGGIPAINTISFYI